MLNIILVISAIVTSVSLPVFIVLGIVANTRSIKVQTIAAEAVMDASESARNIVSAIGSADAKLSSIEKTSTGTHLIVNSQRTAMQHAIMLLARRVADDNPGDKDAKITADNAEESYNAMCGSEACYNALGGTQVKKGT